MATVSWDSQDVIYIDYLEKGKIVTGFYYAELHFAKKKMLFHHDNAPAHTSVVVTAKLVRFSAIRCRIGPII